MSKFAPFLPNRPVDMHKGDRGGVLIVGGSSLYRGAPLLAGRGALRSGCGLVVVFSDESVCSGAAAYLPETIMQTGLFASNRSERFEILESWGTRIDCLVLGPGLGRSITANEIVHEVWNGWSKPLLIDGDALFWLSEKGNKLLRRQALLLTPHEGEAARLLDSTPAYIREFREESVRRLASKYGTTLLKGHSTLVCDGERLETISEGNQTLSVPGSGDVLAGCIAAFAAAGVPLFESACLGAFVHGRAGCELSRKIGIDGVLATEIADEIPHILQEMRFELCETEKNRLG